MTKRDNDYFEHRLQLQRPDIWHDLQIGAYKTVAEARRAAGLGGHRTRLHELKNAWRKATVEQRGEFLGFLDAEGVTLPLSVPASASTPTTTPTAGISTATTATGRGSILAQDGYLTPQAKVRINQIIDQRGLRGRFGEPKLGVIMKELSPPFSPRDASLGSALARGTRLKKDMVDALERWVVKHQGQ